MAILIDKSKRVLVQGITGREGTARTRLMKDYGTNVIAGVTPGRGGANVDGIPVFDSVGAATEALGPLDVSVIFVPAPLVRGAAFEALASGVKLLVIVPDRVPLYDVLEIAAEAAARGAMFTGPNTLGVLSPGNGVLGMMGGRAASASKWFYPGPVGVTSRSGGITTSIAYYLAQAGMGLSTIVHVGGDSVVGMPHPEVLKQFEADPQTECVVMFGEIGTSQEEMAAELIASGGFTKPLIAYIGGKAAKRGTRFSHAGAIVEGNRGTHEGKVAALRAVGAHVVDSFADIPRVTAQVLQRKTISLPPAAERPRTMTQPETPARERTDLHWSSAITQIKPNEIRLRGYRIDELMGQVSFSQAIFLALTGELPSPQVGRLLDAMFVSSIDHGVTPPSALAARTAASTGAPYNAALAVGLLSINQHHGGAIEDSMRMLLRGLELAEGDPARGAAALVAAFRQEKKRLPGMGHRIHTADPRTKRLLEMADEAGIAGDGVAMLHAIESAWAEASGKRLPVNVDGAIAALLVDMKLPTELANTFFMMARLPGLVAQVYEEKTRQRPMRSIHPTDHTYDGAPERHVDLRAEE
jgi:succinyl-CoA synthetase alpha subunit